MLLSEDDADSTDELAPCTGSCSTLFDGLARKLNIERTAGSSQYTGSLETQRDNFGREIPFPFDPFYELARKLNIERTAGR